MNFDQLRNVKKIVFVVLFAALLASSAETGRAQLKFPKIPKEVKTPTVPGAESVKTGAPPAPGSNRQYNPQTGANERVIETGVKNGPAIIKYSVMLGARRTNQSVPLKTGGNATRSAWYPNLEFDLFGPVGSGDAVVVEFYTPDGKLWLTEDVQTYEIKTGEFNKMQAGGDTPSEKATHLDGNFSFKILLKNELKGTNKTLYAGAFKVGKVSDNPSGQPQYKDNYAFYVDQDWNLPLGYVFPNYVDDRMAPPLTATMWFRAKDVDSGDFAAYLYYNGKEIDNTKNMTAGSIATSKQVYGTPAESTFFWTQSAFTFRGVRFFNDSNNSFNYQPHYLDKNPGEYEIKVLWKGKLARTAKFTVKDGKIVDNGNVSANNMIGWEYRVIPVTILGTQDGQIDRNAWKTGAFYGNPLAGFTAQ